MNDVRWSARLGVALAALAALSACGGGGGSTISTPRPQPAPSPAPAPAPTPAPSSPTPSPSPVPSAFNTREFRDSDGPLQHNAATAWNRGITGDGVTIAIVDTGIDVDSPEFAGRLSPASRDIYSDTDGRGLDAFDDHGTNVAMVAAAARDNSGVLGIAWGADILAIRTDTPGSCATEDPEVESSGCNFDDTAIARAIDYAADNGARVVNLSLGGSTPQRILIESVEAAAARGMVIVISSGNDGNKRPDDLAAAISAAAGGSAIIVGSVDENNEISSFSNKALGWATAFITARGEAVCCTYRNGQIYTDNEGYVYLFSGTSFSAPQVSGAVALLAQAFPNLTGKEIVEILLETARDLGADGPDSVYGTGLLDIAAAIQPIGTTSLAGSTQAMGLGDTTGTSSAAMGDAISTASLETVVQDKYRRAYTVDIAGTLNSAQVSQRLHGAVGTQMRNSSLQTENASIAFSIDARGNRAEMPHTGMLRLSTDDAESARVLAARVALNIAPGTQFGFAYAEGADGLVAQMQGQDRPAFMIAQAAGGDDGMFRRTDASVAFRHKLGGWGLTVSAERGENVSGALFRRDEALYGRRIEDPVRTIGLGLDRRFGDVRTSLGLDWMSEDNTMLGARFHDALGVSGADTLFLDTEAGWELAPGWRLGAAARGGWTRAHLSGAVAPGSQLFTSAWSLDLARRGVFAPGDSVGFRVSQPLRVESGGLDLNLPVAFDYATMTPTYGIRSLSLTPQGREIMAELGWRGGMLSGNASASVFYRKDPGHYASLPDDAGVAMRWATKF